MLYYTSGATRQCAQSPLNLTDDSHYEQLGLDFRLYSAEVLFNCGLSRIYMGQTTAGLADLKEAATHKQIPEHSVIDDAIRDHGRDYSVFSVPVGPITLVAVAPVTANDRLASCSAPLRSR